MCNLLHYYYYHSTVLRRYTIQFIVCLPPCLPCYIYEPFLKTLSLSVYTTVYHIIYEVWLKEESNCWLLLFCRYKQFSSIFFFWGNLCDSFLFHNNFPRNTRFLQVVVVFRFVCLCVCVLCCDFVFAKWFANVVWDQHQRVVTIKFLGIVFFLRRTYIYFNWIIFLWNQ